MPIKTVYIASPYTKGDVAINVRTPILVADILREAGYLPYLPLMSHFWHMISPHPYEYWTAMDMEWLYVCDCILRLPGESKGADAEVKRMIELGKPVFYSLYQFLKDENKWKQATVAYLIEKRDCNISISKG